MPSEEDKKNRILRDVTFTATLAGNVELADYAFFTLVDLPDMACDICKRISDRLHGFAAGDRSSGFCSSCVRDLYETIPPEERLQ